MVDLLAGSVVKLLASLEEGSLVGALVTMAASFVFVIVVSLVVVVVAVVEVVGLVLATLLVFDCEDALPTAIITNKINFIRFSDSEICLVVQERQIGPHLFCWLDNIFRQRRRAECVGVCGGAVEVGNVITRITR